MALTHLRLSLLTVLLAASLTATTRAETLRETTEDILGFHLLARDAPAAFAAGARVINFDDVGLFAVIWVPPDYRSQPVRRVLLDLHGTASYAYTGLMKDLPYAQRDKFALVAVQWWRGGPGERYLTATEVYGLVDRALTYMEATYDAQHGRAGLAGFSRGSVEGMEVMARDRAGRQYFAIGIHHSGGIRTSAPWTEFQRLLLSGAIPAAFSGQKFFLYCGELDEQWGAQMCEFMRHANQVIQANGGTVVRFIDDPVGQHGGYHNTPIYHDAGIAAFLEATAPVACTAPLAPSSLSARVSGRVVTLSWSAVLNATTYLVEAGSAPSLANLAVLAITAAGLTVSAPPGRYYVRVRVNNSCGTSAASNEVVVTVA